MLAIKYLFIVIFTIIACSPERDNPLDPRSPYYTGEATIKGTVRNFAEHPIENASVSAHTEDSYDRVTTFTDKDGRFTLAISKGTYNVIATKDGYTESTEKIVISAGEAREVFFNINGIPFFREQKAVSSRRAWIGGTVVDILISANLNDPDGLGDIDSVRVAVSGIDKEMDFNHETQLYECRIRDNECPDGNPELLIGMPFVINAVDKWQTRNTSPQFYLARILSGSPLTIFPAQGDTVTGNGLQLAWRRLKTDFPISYSPQIFIGWPPTVIWEESTSDTLSSEITLHEGEYFYWVTAEDRHGNSSRSMAIRFFVR